MECYFGSLCESLWSALNALLLQLWNEFDKLFAIENGHVYSMHGYHACSTVFHAWLFYVPCVFHKWHTINYTRRVCLRYNYNLGQQALATKL